MNHELYIGKTLREFVKDLPDYAINFYLIVDVRMLALKNIRDDDVFLDKKILKISDLHSDYISYINLM